jgi:hypothetical protein
MATLETQYKNYLLDNPDSDITFEEWKIQLVESIKKSIEEFEKNKIMTEEELKNWEMVRYRMDNEGIDYCFEHYSSFEEIKDEEFHKLRLEFLDSMSKIRKYVKDKIESYDR